MPIIRRAGFTDLHYDEVVKNTPSPEYFLLPGAARARRTLDVPWDRLSDAIKMFLGFPVVQTGGPDGKYIRRNIPDQLRSIRTPGFEAGAEIPYMFASQIERVEPIGATGFYDTYDIATYQKARLYIIYEAPTYPIRVDTDDKVVSLTDPEFPDESRLNRYVTPTHKPSAEFLNLPRGTIFKWVDGKKGGVDFATNVIIPSVEIQLNWHQVPLLESTADGLPTATKTHIGKVNKRIFLDRPVGTLLLAGLDTRRYKLATGTVVHDINYRIKYLDPDNNGRGHNFFLHYNIGVKQVFPFVPGAILAGYRSPVDRYEMTSTGENSAPLDWGDNGSKPVLIDSPIPIFGYADFELLFKPV